MKTFPICKGIGVRTIPTSHGVTASAAPAAAGMQCECRHTKDVDEGIVEPDVSQGLDEQPIVKN